MGPLVPLQTHPLSIPLGLEVLGGWTGWYVSLQTSSFFSRAYLTLYTDQLLRLGLVLFNSGSSLYLLSFSHSRHICLFLVPSCVVPVTAHLDPYSRVGRRIGLSGVNLLFSRNGSRVEEEVATRYYTDLKRSSPFPLFLKVGGGTCRQTWKELRPVRRGDPKTKNAHSIREISSLGNPTPPLNLEVGCLRRGVKRCRISLKKKKSTSE